MANCHLLRALQTLILTFPCIFALVSFSMWPQTQDLVAISPPATDHHHRHHHQQQRNQLHPGAASLRGRRTYQEDRLVCAPDLQIPSLSADGNYSLLTTAGLYGVFDGHVGDEASDFAATSIMQRFLHHVSHLAGISSSCTSQLLVGNGQPNASTTCFNWSMAERALRDSIADIDASFHMEATKHGLKSGSTACVMLHIDNQLLVANVGDSKALVCSSCGGAKRDESSGEQVNGLDYKGHLMRSKRSRSSMSRSSKKAVHAEGLCVQELSSDHRPDRSDEKLRIEASGGFVTSGTLSRVNGQLAVSRSIGDIEFKRFGVTSEPEISSWHVSENDTFLVLASDGIFERMNPQDVCNVLHAAESGQDITAVLGGLKEDNALIALPLPGMELPKPDFNRDVHKLQVDANPTMLANHAATVDACFREDSFKVDSWSADILSATFWRGATGMAHVMAQILVEVAYRAGSMDNLSALVIPLKQSVPEYL